MSERTKESWWDDCVALQQNGDLGAAVSELKRLIEVYPDYALARLALAVFSLDKGDEQTTLEQMEKACELEQDDPFYFTAFSALAIKCGNHELAEDALMKANEARFAAQLRKMNELRKKELAERAESEKTEEQSSAES